MKSEETWEYIHGERGDMAETLSALVRRPMGRLLVV